MFGNYKALRHLQWPAVQAQFKRTFSAILPNSVFSVFRDVVYKLPELSAHHPHHHRHGDPRD